jgi:hypothetical protein
MPIFAGKTFGNIEKVDEDKSGDLHRQKRP